LTWFYPEQSLFYKLLYAFHEKTGME